MRSWFETKSCNSLEINFSDRKTKDKTNVQILDLKVIQHLMSRIEAISPDGDEMISMIVAEEIQLTFKCEAKSTIVLFQNGMLKTPSTGFHSGDKDAGLAKELYVDVKKMLKP